VDPVSPGLAWYSSMIRCLVAVSSIFPFRARPILSSALSLLRGTLYTHYDRSSHSFKPISGVRPSYFNRASVEPCSQYARVDYYGLQSNGSDQLVEFDPQLQRIGASMRLHHTNHSRFH
jgi:hypothetical protein